MKLQQAETIAKNFLSEIKEFCERIEIAGSIRRKKTRSQRHRHSLDTKTERTSHPEDKEDIQSRDDMLCW
jgi:hypothetical protein